MRRLRQTPVKLATQLFGDRMLITKRNGLLVYLRRFRTDMPLYDQQGRQRPGMGELLFEDNAEFGYGMAIAMIQRRAKLEGRRGKGSGG